jgi:hypothetical protein
MSNGKKKSARIPCSPEIQQALRDFSNGLGLNYDEALRFMLEQITGSADPKDRLIEGHRMREQAIRWKEHRENSH